LSLTPVETEDEAQDEFPFPHDELEPGQALLLVKRGPNAGSTFLLTDVVTSVGRNTDSGVFLDDITVSRSHATIERRDGDAFFVKVAARLTWIRMNLRNGHAAFRWRNRRRRRVANQRA
jgi:pSer/pThr/pTyr-binding forkhead associated (FHA) protein